MKSNRGGGDGGGVGVGSIPQCKRNNHNVQQVTMIINGFNATIISKVIGQYSSFYKRTIRFHCSFHSKFRSIHSAGFLPMQLKNCGPFQARNINQTKKFQ